MGFQEVYRPAVWFGCSRAIDLVDAFGGAVTAGQDGVAETGISYTGTVFDNGDVDVQCEASIGTLESSAGSAYYPGVVVGASTGGCSAGTDYPLVDDGLAGYWYFFVGDGGPRAEYQDSDQHPLSGQLEMFSSSDCNVLIADGDGEWTQGDLSFFAQ